MKIQTDIAIIGSGFAGSLTALILNKIGFDVTLIDRSTHPRFAIGESSTPAGNLILRDLAEKYDLPRLLPLTAFGPWQETCPEIGGGRKRGFSYFAHNKGEVFTTHADHPNELLVAASRDDYHSDTQWLREDVDAFLYSEALNTGVRGFENTEVLSLEEKESWHIACSQNGASVTLTARFVIDASGRGSLLARHLNIPDQTSALHTRTRAVFTHLDGIPTWHDYLINQGAKLEDHPYYCDDAAVHHLLEEGWLWALRFASGRTSVGIVAPDRDDQHQAFDFYGIIKHYPSLADLFVPGELSVRPGAWIRTGRIQHLWQRAAGTTWSMLPYTAGFIDPLHSTGIAHSISGIERLVGILENHWNQDSLSEELASYSDTLIKELRHIDRLVSMCYMAMPHFDLLVPCLMLYFASAITFEEDRIACRETGRKSPRLFLCAEDTELGGVLEGIADQLRVLESRKLNKNDIQHFSQRVASAIAPFNTAGLFAPQVPNMYEYTATV